MSNSGRLIQLLSLGNFVIGMGAFVVIGVLSPITTGLGMRAAGAGLVMTVYAITYAVSSPLLIAGCGTMDRRKVLLVGLVLFLLGNLFSALAINPLGLYLARMVAACGAGMFTPVAAGVVVAVTTPERRGQALSMVFLGLTVAQVVGVPAGSFLGYSFGWQAAFWCVAVLCLVVLLLVNRLVPPGLPIQVTSLADLGKALCDLPRFFAAAFTGAFLVGIFLVYTFIALLLEERLGLGRDGITLFLLLFGLGAVVGNLLGGYLNDRLGAYRTLLLLCMAQTVLMPMFSLDGLSISKAMLLIFIWSLAGWSFMAPQQVRLVTLAADKQNIFLALNASFIYVGTSVGSAIGGVVVEQYGLEMLGWAGGVCGLVALLQLMVSQRWATARTRRNTV